LPPPPVPTNVTNVPLKRKEWERGIREFTYFFCALSTPTTLLLPLVTLSLYFEGFQDEMEEDVNQTIYLFLMYTLNSYPSSLPLVTLSLYFERFHSPSH
jgi:hypothetical protein